MSPPHLQTGPERGLQVGSTSLANLGTPKRSVEATGKGGSLAHALPMRRRGAYSYPTYGAEDGDREAYARPVNNLLFFAGEATHPGINPCIHAAMETGVRAAFQAAASLATVQSRL